MSTYEWMVAALLRTRRAVASAALLAAVAGAVPLSPAAAQQRVEIPDPGEALYEVRLADGSELVARITAVEDDRIVFTTSGGSRVEVERSQVLELRPARGEVVEGEFWRADPNQTRLFFTSTGRSLRRGEAYVGTYFLALPFVAVGITDRLTVAAGAPVLFGEFEPVYVAPKLQLVKRPGTEISAGVLAFIFDSELVGITYGVGTFGTEHDALTAGVGFGFSGSDFEGQPVAMIGGETRVSRRLKLITENYFLPGETGVALSGGARFIMDRLSVDVGVAGGIGDGDAGCCLPLLNVSYAFGEAR